MNFLLVSIGAVFGASLRYLLSELITHKIYGVLVANMLGSFIAGTVFIILTEKIQLSDNYRLILLVGFCGSLTTLSTISLDSINLFTNLNHNYITAVINLTGNVVLSVMMIIIAMHLIRALW